MKNTNSSLTVLNTREHYIIRRKIYQRLLPIPGVYREPNYNELEAETKNLLFLIYRMNYIVREIRETISFSFWKPLDLWLCTDKL